MKDNNIESGMDKETKKILGLDNNIGCGIKFRNIGGYQRQVQSNRDFICGVPNGNGLETFCKGCKQDMKAKWDEDDRTSDDPRIREIYRLRKEGRLNY